MAGSELGSLAVESSPFQTLPENGRAPPHAGCLHAIEQDESGLNRVHQDLRSTTWNPAAVSTTEARARRRPAGTRRLEGAPKSPRWPA